MIGKGNMNKKETVEKLIAIEYLKKTVRTDFLEDKVLLGDHTLREPDIKYLNIGIELGGILSQINTQIDIFEGEFFETINRKIQGLIYPNFVIKFIMQEEKEFVEYSPTEEFKQYEHLPRFLSGFFLYLCEEPQKKQIFLNQKNEMRIPTFPNPRRDLEIDAFTKELATFINTLDPQKFRDNAFTSTHRQYNSRCVHYIVCNGKVVRNKPDPLAHYFPESILDKFRKNKYSGNFTEKVLLLHNFNHVSENTFSSDIHFYQHYRDNIFNRVFDLISEYDTFHIYTKICFIDFSISPNLENFELIDFSQYRKREVTCEPALSIRICVPLGMQ